MKYLGKILVFLILISVSCTQAPPPTPLIHIKTTTAIGAGDEQVKSEKVTQVTSNYFEVKLSVLADDPNSIAGGTIEQSGVGEPFKYVFFNIVSADEEVIKFKTPTEFLNFMTEHRYEMVDQKKSQNSTDYTFRKD